MYNPILDFKRNAENGECYDYSFMFMQSSHVSAIYGSLLKERNNIRTLLTHYEETPTANSAIRIEVLKQAKSIDELIKEIESCFEKQAETKLFILENQIIIQKWKQ